MNKMLLASVAAAVLMTAAPAQEIPTLSQFLLNCSRDNAVCRRKLSDYVTAAKTQNIICLPQGTSIGEAASSTLSWLRSDEADSMKNGPFDDALYAGTTKLFPCKSATPQPPVPPPADPSATPPQQ